MINVKTSRMPTTWLASVTEIARITMKTMDKLDNETPRASARSGWTLAKRSFRETNSNVPRLIAERNSV